ncbi:MAG: GFA family protein [Burkholderiaceae bacterium]
MQQRATVTGSCLCGGERFELAGTLREVVLCHCAMCRKTHGHIGAYTNAPKICLHLTETRGLKWYSSSSFARRGFCGECGATLFWERPQSESISIAAGVLDSPTGLTTTLQIFVDSAGNYYAIDPNIARRKD